MALLFLLSLVYGRACICICDGCGVLIIYGLLPCLDLSTLKAFVSLDFLSLYF